MNFFEIWDSLKSGLPEEENRILPALSFVRSFAGDTYHSNYAQVYENIS